MILNNFLAAWLYGGYNSRVNFFEICVVTTMPTIEKPQLVQQFEQRKQDHIRLALKGENEALGHSGLDRVQLIHEAIPELDFSDVTIGTDIFGHSVAAPLLISSMTAGHFDAININLVLAEACAARNWIMGVGSQRRQLFDSEARNEWQTIRRQAKNAKLLGNIGLAQLIQTDSKEIQALADSLEAIAMIVHTNPLQECFQPEGTPHFKNAYASLERCCRELTIPVIIKETGCGFSAKTLQRLTNTGVAAVDVSGFGGTHWGRIEGQRAESDLVRANAAISFKNWGISTIDSLLTARAAKLNYAIWASGGIRSGLDAAKCFALGAQVVGIAKPMLEAALQGFEQLMLTMETYEFELKTALFCTGNATLQALQENESWQIT